MKARLHLEKDFRIGAIDRRLFGSFVEHLGRAVYGGIWEPGHPTADEGGYRRDVLSLVRELELPLVRYPGGNFVCGYDWQDSVGPRESRPRRLDLAWRSIEPNLFGLNEFIAWTKLAGTSPMMALNLGTRGVDAAVALLEYCNFPGGTKFSDLRRSHGVADPHDLRLWCLGNEMDGPWQVGQKTAEEYGRLAAETGKALRLLDPKIELVACGSSFAAMPTFPDWEATVLDLAWDQVDYLSLHSYYDNRSGDRDDFLASSAGMDAFIEAVTATCDHVKARKRSSKTVMLSFDEWNVWFRKPADERHVEPWRVAPPLLEEVYTLEDALAVGCLLASLLRHADRVKIACLAQLVNVLAPIMTRTGGPAWRQTIFWPFLHASRYARGESLSLLVDCPRYESARFGEVPWLEAAASLDEEQGKMAIFAVNRSSTEIIELEARLGGLAGWRAVERLELSGPDPLATNSEHEPGAVAPRNLAIEGLLDGEKLRAVLPPLSWTVLRLEGPRL